MRDRHLNHLSHDLPFLFAQLLAASFESNFKVGIAETAKA